MPTQLHHYLLVGYIKIKIRCTILSTPITDMEHLQTNLKIMSEITNFQKRLVIYVVFGSIQGNKSFSIYTLN